MTKAVRLRRLANVDLEDAVDYYAEEAGETLAMDFIRAYETAIRLIAEQPGSGALRYAEILSLPGLKFWPLQRFPYLIFYREEETHIEIWRILHGHRDIGSLLEPQA